MKTVYLLEVERIRHSNGYAWDQIDWNIIKEYQSVSENELLELMNKTKLRSGKTFYETAKIAKCHIDPVHGLQVDEWVHYKDAPAVEGVEY